MSINLRFISCFLLASMVTVAAWSQIQNSNILPKINSPLSRFGLGDPLPQHFSMSSGMGGLGAGLQDAYHLNMLNPASLATLQTATFEGAMFLSNTGVESAQSKASYGSGNLQYLALGFSLRNAINRTLDRANNNWNAGMALALVPYTQVGYNIRLVDTQTPGVEITTNDLKGSGGTYRLRWGTGFRYKQFSLGADVSFLFGQLINSRLVTFDSLDNSLNAEFLEDLSVRGTQWNVGGQYAFQFKKYDDKKGQEVPTSKQIVVGATLSNQANFDTDATLFRRRYLGRIISDTLVEQSTIIGSGVLPSSFSVGVHFQNINKLNIGLEYGATAWSNYENTGKPENLLDAWYVAMGLEYVPNHISYNKYLQRVRYRLGFRYATDARSLNGEQAKGYALTLGAGFPLILPRQQISFINTALELGKTGVQDVLDQSYIRFTLGFTLNDNSWFFKRKFN